MNANYILVSLAVGVLFFGILRFFQRPRIKNISGKLPKGSGRYKSRALEDITDITYHHTAGPPDQTTESIARYHVFSKEWPGIGYHYVISQDGTIEQTNPLSLASYHNGYNNSKAVGVALKGNFQLNEPNSQQLDSLVSLARHLKRKLPNLTSLVGHKEYPGASTSCPGVFSGIEMVRSKAKLNNPYGGPVSYSASFASSRRRSRYDASKADN